MIPMILNDRVIVRFKDKEEPYNIIKAIDINVGADNSPKGVMVWCSLLKKEVMLKPGKPFTSHLSGLHYQFELIDIKQNTEKGHYIAKIDFSSESDDLEFSRLQNWGGSPKNRRPK